MNGEQIGAVRLPDVAIHVGTRFVGGPTLHGLGRLAELQVETRAEPAPGIAVRRLLEDDGRLIQTEAIAQHVVGAQQVDATKRAVEIVAVITVNGQVDRRVAPEIECFAIISGKF